MVASASMIPFRICSPSYIDRVARSHSAITSSSPGARLSRAPLSCGRPARLLPDAGDVARRGGLQRPAPRSAHVLSLIPVSGCRFCAIMRPDKPCGIWGCRATIVVPTLVARKSSGGLRCNSQPGGSWLHGARKAHDHRAMNNHDGQQRRIEDIVRGDPDPAFLLTAELELGLLQWRVVAARIVPHYLAALPASAARRLSRSCSRLLPASVAANSNEACASSKRPSFCSRSPRTLGSRW